MISTIILVFVAGYAHAECDIDSPKGTQVTLTPSRADSFTTVDMSWENEQMVNGLEHLITWHSTLPKKSGSFRYVLKYSFDNVNYKKMASNLVATSSDGTYEYGGYPWMPPSVKKSKKIYLRLQVKKLNGTLVDACTKMVFIVTEDPVSIAIEQSKDGLTWKRLSEKPVDGYPANPVTVSAGGTGSKCLATRYYRVLYLSGTDKVLGLGTNSIIVLNTSDQISKVAGSGTGYISDYLGLKSTLSVQINKQGTVNATVTRQGVDAKFNGSATAACTGNGEQLVVSLSGDLNLPPGGTVFSCNGTTKLHMAGDDGYSDEPYTEVSGNMIDECGNRNFYYWKKN
jgi:hypothetical protein